MKKIIKDSSVGYIAFLVLIYFAQGFFVYHPQTIPSYDQKAVDQIGGKIVEEKGLEWVFLPADRNTGKTLVYFHGNGGMAIDRAWKASFWRDAGYNVVLAEYPGYGTNTGKPSEQRFFQAGRIIINRTKADFPNTDLYIYGESIGSGTAVQMAGEYDEKALIIESGFSSLVDVAFSKLPIIPTGILLKDRFMNVDKINDIQSDLLVLHGTKDTLVPIKFGKRLFDAFAGNKKIIEIDGAGHNNIYLKSDMNEVIKEFEKWNGQ